MLHGIERLVDLTGIKTSGDFSVSHDTVRDAIHAGDVDALGAIPGHFAGTSRDGQTVRMARTVGQPLRYFVAKMFHGPFLVVGERMDTIYDWCVSQNIGWQFDPMYTRMVPAHYLIELDQIGCPDPAPRCHRFWTPDAGNGPTDVNLLGKAYVEGAYTALKGWLAGIPASDPVGLAFSGGIDSTAVLLLARKAMTDLGRSADQIRPFTLDLGGGADAAQAERMVNDLEIASTWERITADPKEYDLIEAIRTIEDYHPLDVECAAAGICLMRGIRAKHPELKWMLDGDGGDENLKSYPLEDSDLTLSSILRNPLLYQEGWGIDAIKHSMTYSGGLSRAYVRSWAPAERYGFSCFSPFTDRRAMTAAVTIPFNTILDGSLERLYSLKGELVASGVRQVTGSDMPVQPKRRFQDGIAQAAATSAALGGDTENNAVYKGWRVGKAWCRRTFLRQWEDRLRTAWEEAEHVSGNHVPGLPEPLLQ